MSVSVLVVDDEPDVEMLFRREVRDGLYAFDFARSGKGVRAKLDGSVGEQIILLVSDINMPGMSGLEPYREARPAKCLIADARSGAGRPPAPARC